MAKYEGSCGCGHVKYAFEGEPINAAFCYCKECQKHTGSDKWFGLWVPKDKFAFTKGETKSYTRKGDSSKDIHHQFCSRCGTTVCVEVTVAGFYSVSASTLDDSSHFSPKMAIYTASAPKWAVFPEDVPKFDILPPEFS
ncbi:GFA family protein [Endozoicomonas sp. SM1973]|uniref:GFA family protein n=1 Tax=Spartinivicinus marinus TaxID=2994442 RepID=A0A853IAW1_9GAMM|nr:GFA family protein [Spartinivicinus marinus]MCX4027780.1 GFA family protein [Spartinivicinus marinus]NYZ68962.1 GFA family protein [Spartinivicinus marinus]